MIPYKYREGWDYFEVGVTVGSTEFAIWVNLLSWDFFFNVTLGKDLLHLGFLCFGLGHTKTEDE